jgi:hypothetical protein
MYKLLSYGVLDELNTNVTNNYIFKIGGVVLLKSRDMLVRWWPIFTDLHSFAHQL